MKVLLLYATPKSGHAQASHALAQAFNSANGYEVEEYHVQLKSPLYASFLSSSYRWLVSRTPHVWGHFHGNTHYAGLMKVIVWFMYVFDTGGFLRKAQTFKPDIVVAMHVLPLHILGRAKRKGRLSAKLYVLTTDLWAHAFWYHRSADKFFASSERAKQDLIRAGAVPQKVFVTGIPVKSTFLSLPNKFEARQELNLDPRKITLLVMGGSYGLFPFIELLERVLRDPELGACQWLFLCGSKKKVFNQAQALLNQKPAAHVHVFGFRNDVATIMSACDLMVTKPGGISSSEALVCGLPMFIFRPLPGQEQVNAEILAAEGAGLVASSLLHLVDSLRTAIRQPQTLLRMRGACLSLARPKAGADIVRLCKEHD